MLADCVVSVVTVLTFPNSNSENETLKRRSCQHAYPESTMVYFCFTHKMSLIGAVELSLLILLNTVIYI